MRGIGYVEFLSCQKEIDELLSKGYTISAIHRKLYNEKKITIGVKRFYAILSKKGIKKLSLKQLKIAKDIFNNDINKNLSHNYLTPIQKSNDESNLPTDQEDDFVIIRKPKDEIF